METIHSSVTELLTSDWLKRLFWPRVASQRDVDLVGQQGFWICVVVGTAWMVGSLFTSQPYLDLLIGIAYFLGAMGVRQRSVPAAVLVFLCLFLDRVAALEAMVLEVPGGGNPLIGVTAIVLLFLNIRATYLAHRWVEGMREDWQPYFTKSIRARLVDLWPSKLWPWTRYVFYPLAGLIVLTSLVALFSMPVTHVR